MRTVLIIEDETNLAELIKERLEQKGYKTCVAYTGKSGIKLASDTSLDVITLDIHLPDISGIEVLKTLKRNKDKQSIPVIVVTCDDTIERECREQKADGFIKKPIDFSKLEEILKLVTESNKKTSKEDSK